MTRGAAVPAAEPRTGVLPSILTAARWTTTVAALAVAGVATILICLHFG
jgi:hypothetical protein